MEGEDLRMSPPPVPLPEESADISASRSYTPETTDVGEQFAASCSITEEMSSSPSSKASEHYSLQYPESDIATNNDNDGRDKVAEAISDDLGSMEVDETSVDNMILGADPVPSSKPLSSASETAPRHLQPSSTEDLPISHSKPLSSVSQPVSLDELRSATSSVPSTSFYASNTRKGEGRNKITTIFQPFPLSLDDDVDVDISDDANDQNEVDDLLAEAEAPQSTYVLISCFANAYIQLSIFIEPSYSH